MFERQTRGRERGCRVRRVVSVVRRAIGHRLGGGVDRRLRLRAVRLRGDPVRRGDVRQRIRHRRRRRRGARVRLARRSRRRNRGARADRRAVARRAFLRRDARVRGVRFRCRPPGQVLRRAPRGDNAQRVLDARVQSDAHLGDGGGELGDGFVSRGDVVGASRFFLRVEPHVPDARARLPLGARGEVALGARGVRGEERRGVRDDGGVRGPAGGGEEEVHQRLGGGERRAPQQGDRKQRERDARVAARAGRAPPRGGGVHETLPRANHSGCMRRRDAMGLGAGAVQAPRLGRHHL